MSSAEVAAHIASRALRAPEERDARRRFYITRASMGVAAFLVALLLLWLSPLLDAFFTDGFTPPALYLALIAAMIGGLLTSIGYSLQVLLEFGPGSVSQSATTSEVDRLHIVLPRQMPAYEEVASSVRSRLAEEIKNQGNKANTNLIVGAITAALGLTFLGWLTLDTARWAFPETAPRTITASPMFYWGQFAAKVAFSLSANAFSLFFLSTYRRTLTEIKYFQNELTNVDMKLISLFLAGHEKFEDVQKQLLIELASVERNFVLRKGETTADAQLKSLDGNDLAIIAALISQAHNQPNLMPVPPKRSTAPKRV